MLANRSIGRLPFFALYLNITQDWVHNCHWTLKMTMSSSTFASFAKWMKDLLQTNRLSSSCVLWCTKRSSLSSWICLRPASGCRSSSCWCLGWRSRCTVCCQAILSDFYLGVHHFMTVIATQCDGKHGCTTWLTSCNEINVSFLEIWKTVQVHTISTKLSFGTYSTWINMLTV